MSTYTSIPLIILYIREKYFEDKSGGSKLFKKNANISLTDLFNDPLMLLIKKPNEKPVYPQSQISLDDWIACVVIQRYEEIFEIPTKNGFVSRPVNKFFEFLQDKIGRDMYRLDVLEIVYNKTKTDVLKLEENGTKIIRNKDSDPVLDDKDNIVVFDKKISSIIPNIDNNTICKINLLLLQSFFGLMDSAIRSFLLTYNISYEQYRVSQGPSIDNKKYSINLSKPNNIFIDIEQVLKFTYIDNDNNDQGEDSLTFTIRFYIGSERVYLFKLSFGPEFTEKLLRKVIVNSELTKISDITNSISTKGLAEPKGIIETQTDKLPSIFNKIQKIWFDHCDGNECISNNYTFSYIQNARPIEQTVDVLFPVIPIVSPVLKYKSLNNGTSAIGYTVKVTSDFTTGKKKCIFAVPNLQFKYIADKLREKAALSNPANRVSEKARIENLIKIINDERSECKYIGSSMPFGASFSKLFKGGRKTRKLNKNKLKRKKTNRRIQKKQRKTHKRR